MPAKKEIPTVLISMDYEDWSAIGRRIKTHLFRKQALKPEPVLAFVYLKKPEGFICGAIGLGEPVRMSVAKMADISRRWDPHSEAEVREYFRGRRFGFAIPILSQKPMLPVRLKDLQRIMRAEVRAPAHYLDLDKNEPVRRFLLTLLWNARFYGVLSDL